jgi:hypothetical protein
MSIKIEKFNKHDVDVWERTTQVIDERERALHINTH